MAPKVEQAPVPLGDVDATYADVYAGARRAGWEPRIPLAQGLKSVLAWVKEHPYGVTGVRREEKAAKAPRESL